ncbi:MAG: glycosyltransferase family 87 protein [Pseudomonadota bacterium]
MNNISIKLSFYYTTIRNAIGVAVSPEWSSMIIILAFLYAPFLLEYGWEYRNIANVDLPSFYSASIQVFEHGESPYDREVLQLVMEKGVYVHPYLYPPPSLLFFYPLSLIDYATARHLVLFGNHLIIIALLFVIPLFLLRASSKTHFPLIFVLTFVYSLTFTPTVVTLNHGQTNLLLLAFILCFWLLARKKHAVTASLFLALAVFLKTYPLIILPMLLVTGHRRECAYTAVWLGLGTIIALLILPSVIWNDWFLNVLPAGEYTRIPPGLFSPASVFNQSLNGFFARAFTENPWSPPRIVDASLARTLTYASAGLIAAISGMAALRAYKIHSTSLDRTMIVILPAMYLVAPFSWEHHLVYLLPSILMLLTARSRLPIAATLLFYSASMGAAMLIGLNRGLPFKFFGVLVLWVLCIFTACSKHIQLSNDFMENDA